MSLASAIGTMVAVTAQNRPESVKASGLKFTFMPATPAMRAPGRGRIDARVSTLTISFVRCSVRTISTSNELAIPSFASRADSRAASTLVVSSANRSADPSEEIGSNSEWLSAANSSR